MNLTLRLLALSTTLAIVAGCAAMPGGVTYAESTPSAALAPAPAPLAPPPAPAQPAPAQPSRILVYSASVRMVVSNVAHALDAIRRQATDAGGYLHELDGCAITIRIPAARFHEALSAIERLGEITHRAVKAQDVTEEMRDLRIRLDNALQTRQRLIQLLEKSQKMEDTIKIEAELERITQTIELLKGKIAYLESQAAFSTIRVELNSPLPQKQLVAQIPFEWVRQLGDGLVTGQASSYPDAHRRRVRGPEFKLPKSYIRYFDRENYTEAMSADGVLLKVQRHDNYAGGDLDFWSALARRVLVEQRAIALDKSADLRLGRKSTARLYPGRRDLAGAPQGYLLAIAATPRYIYTFEAHGPETAFVRDRAIIETAIGTLEVED